MRKGDLGDQIAQPHVLGLEEQALPIKKKDVVESGVSMSLRLEKAESAGIIEFQHGEKGDMKPVVVFRFKYRTRGKSRNL